MSHSSPDHQQQGTAQVRAEPLTCSRKSGEQYTRHETVEEEIARALGVPHIRRPGLCSDIQTKHRIMMTGPTTLAALLSSLQMGFRTLAIEKRSSEVWQVLSAAKTEFRRYGEVWDKIGRQLDTAKKTVDEAGKRTRAVERKLRSVETLEGLSVDDVLGISSAGLEEEPAEEAVEDISETA
jgi:DNA anti-recombination protein RmuC